MQYLACWYKQHFKVLANEDTLLRTHCCSWCIACCANWETFVADTKCFWPKSETFFVSRTQNLCPQQMLRARANGETFVLATMCPQQCVLVCQYLYTMCRSRKHPYSPHWRDWNFLGGWGLCKTKKLKEMYEALLEFPEGLGGEGKGGGS